LTTEFNSEVSSLSIVIPCLNEAETLATVIKKCFLSTSKMDMPSEIIVADNGSSDGSKPIALALGCKVIDVSQKGYGAALIGGISAASGKYVVMGDADDSYSMDELEGFIKKLEEGFDLVIGNRFVGGIEQDAMPWLHKWIGNPILSYLGRKFFKIKIGDFHCGLRAFNRTSILSLGLNSQGMEFASEMVVKAALNNLKITEIPTRLSKDGRSGKPHLRTWRDGWRHLIFLLAASPRWLFLYPGLFLMLTGIIGALITTRGEVIFLGLGFSQNTFLISLALLMAGAQTLLLSILARIFSSHHGFLPRSRNIALVERLFTLERGIALGLLFVGISFFCLFYLIHDWTGDNFESLSTGLSLRIAGLIILSLTLGIQIVYASFFASLIQV